MPPQRGIRVHPSTQENQMPLWTGQRCEEEGGPQGARTVMRADHAPRSPAARTLLARSAPSLSTEASTSDVTAVSRFTPLPTLILHSERFSPPVEERKAETPLSKQSGSSRKPAEALNLQLHKARVWSAHAPGVLTMPLLRGTRGFLPTQHRKLHGNRPRMALTPCPLGVG